MAAASHSVLAMGRAARPSLNVPVIARVADVMIAISGRCRRCRTCARDTALSASQVRFGVHVNIQLVGSRFFVLYHLESHYQHLRGARRAPIDLGCTLTRTRR